jgi:CubicO group peptidase (beta-lactamase class C family)
MTTATGVSIGGFTAPGFESVRERFDANFREFGERGAAVCAYRDGQSVVDLWGGEAEPGRSWERDTPAIVMSAGKGVVALVAQVLEERGLVDVDDPVARYWPEFATHGRGEVTIAMVLTHRAGMPWFEDYHRVCDLDRPASFLDTEGIVAAIESSPPVMEPGTLAYHSQTMGFIIGEVTRRVTGLTIGRFLADQICEPLGAEFYVGLPLALAPRVATLSCDEAFDSEEIKAFFSAETPGGRSMLCGPQRHLGEIVRRTLGDVDFMRSELAAAGPVGTARGLARLYAVLAHGGELDGVTLVSPESIERFSAAQVRGTDASWLQEYNLALGYQRGLFPGFSWGPHAEAFGHSGMGGATGFADPVGGISFGYVTNHFRLDVGVDLRVQALIDALYACVA